MSTRPGAEPPRDEPEPLARGLLAMSVGPRVRPLRNLLTARVMSAIAPFGFRSGTLTTMTLIAANPGSSQAVLAREIGIDKSGLVAILDDLETKGLAARGRSTEDRRRNALALTPEGDRVMQAMYDAILSVEEPIRAALSKDELATLIKLLDRTYHALKKAGE